MVNIMIIMMKERHAHEKKYYYKTYCPKCDSKFAFSSDDTINDANDDVVICPICETKIDHYVAYETVYSNFKRISQWRYNRLMRKHSSKKEL